MRRLALRLSARAHAQPPALPESIAILIDPVVDKAREDFRVTADALTRVFREGSTRVPIPSTNAARESFRNALQEVRSQNLLAGQSLDSVRKLSCTRAQTGCRRRRFGDLPRSNAIPGAGALLG
jgi:hypothetical protein